MGELVCFIRGVEPGEDDSERLDGGWLLLEDIGRAAEFNTSLALGAGLDEFAWRSRCPLSVDSMDARSTNVGEGMRPNSCVEGLLALSLTPAVQLRGPSSGRDGRDPATDVFRGTVENGGGRDSSTERYIRPLLNSSS